MIKAQELAGRLIFAGMSLVALASCAAMQPAGSPNDDFLHFRKMQEIEAAPTEKFGTKKAKWEALSAEFDRIGSLPSRHAINEDQLRMRFEAAHMAAFYADAGKYYPAMQRAYRSLEDSGRLKPLDSADMLEIALRARRFDDARLLGATQPDAEVIPEVGDSGAIRGASVLAVVDAAQMERRAFVWRPGYTILAIGHPDCHFSQQAVADIENDPALRRVFAQHAAWVAPQSGNLKIKRFLQWNRTHPAFVMDQAWRKQDWPMVDDWSTPVFYVVRDGQVLGKVTGWPAQGNVAALKAMIETMPGE